MTNTETMSRPIRNIHALNRAIHELKDRQKELEGKLEQNFQHLSGNYMSMGMNSLFGGKRPGAIFGLIWLPGLWRVKNSRRG